MSWCGLFRLPGIARIERSRSFNMCDVASWFDALVTDASIGGSVMSARGLGYIVINSGNSSREPGCSPSCKSNQTRCCRECTDQLRCAVT